MDSVIHFVDVAATGPEPRPVCGAWHDRVTWTTIRTLMTCPACARLMRVRRPERPEDASASTSPRGADDAHLPG